MPVKSVDWAAKFFAFGSSTPCCASGDQSAHDVTGLQLQPYQDAQLALPTVLVLQGHLYLALLELTISVLSAQAARPPGKDERTPRPHP